MSMSFDIKFMNIEKPISAELANKTLLYVDILTII